MKYPNAQKGINLVFIGVILSLISGAMLVVAQILLFLGAENMNEALAVSGAGLALFASWVAVGTLIVTLIGLMQAKRDHRDFGFAFWVIIGSLILGVASGFTGFFPTGTAVTIVKTILDVIVEASSTTAWCFVVAGLAALAKSLGNESFSKKGRLLFVVLFGLVVIGIALSVVSTVVSTADPTLTNAMIIVAIMANNVQIISGILFLVYLGVARKILKK